MAYKNHRDLKVWQQAMQVAKLTYEITRQFPKEELFGLTSQMQRAAVSIPSNIAEGNGRDSHQEFERFLKISTGSACELQTQAELALSFGYINVSDFNTLNNLIESTLKMIYALRKTLNTKHQSQRTSSDGEPNTKYQTPNTISDGVPNTKYQTPNTIQ